MSVLTKCPYCGTMGAKFNEEAFSERERIVLEEMGKAEEPFLLAALNAGRSLANILAAQLVRDGYLEVVADKQGKTKRAKLYKRTDKFLELTCIFKDNT